MNKPEQVLCFPITLLKDHEFQGVLPQPSARLLLAEILLSDELLFLERDRAEKDENYKQLIPYCLLQKEGKLLAYRRTKKGGEDRLHEKWSVGVGGHVNPRDGHTGADAYWDGFRRELEEEVSLTEPLFWRVLGLLNDDSNDVGRVHLGVIHHVGVKGELAFKDKALDDCRFVTIEEAVQLPLENWSRLVLETLGSTLVAA